MLEDIVHGALAGIAIGGFVAAMVNANIIAVKALLRFNHMAITTAWNMSKSLERVQMHRELQRWKQQRAKNEDADYEDEDEDDDDDDEN